MNSDKQPIGLHLPIRMGKTGFFDQTFTTLEEARGSLINLLKTRKGERIMHPDFGTDIYSLLFEQITPSLLDEIEAEIRNAINTWLPYIEIGEIIVNTSDRLIELNRIEIHITYGLKKDTSQFDELIVVYQF